MLDIVECLIKTPGNDTKMYKQLKKYFVKISAKQYKSVSVRLSAMDTWPTD